MLSSATDFKAQILTLSPTTDSTAGAIAFVGVIANFMNEVQAGATGSPGIFTLSQSTMIPLLAAMPPVADNSWVPVWTSAWQTTVEASVITPGTVTNPIWLGSGSLDVATLSSAAATITTLSDAVSTLETGLYAISSASDQPLQFATAIRNATLAFVFNCIGLGAPPSLIPIPIPISAE